MRPEATTERSLVAAAADFIDAGGLLAPRTGVVVAVSGGADSVALLAVLRELADDRRRAYRLSVAHLDHGLRDESPADAAFVASLANEWGLACNARRVDTAALAEEWRIGIEATARRARYEFLARSAEEAGATCVAVAHHADDNAETILHRILRGSHLRGVAGMPARRPLEGTSAALVRPLLACRRAEIEAFCRSRDLAWRTDHTNADTAYTRNFIRHELLPLIRERINPNVDEALLRLARAAAETGDIIAERADELSGSMSTEGGDRVVLDAAALAGAHPATRRWLLREALERLGVSMGSVTAETLDRLAALCEEAPNAPRAVNLPGARTARRDAGRVVIASAVETDEAPADPVALAVPGATVLPGGGEVVCSLAAMDRRTFDEHRRLRPPGAELLDADRVRGKLVCRARAAGDRFRPLGSPGRRSVGDFLTDLKLDNHRRRSVRCICDADGIVYVAPLRISERVKITPKTSRVLRIEVRAGCGGP